MRYAAALAYLNRIQGETGKLSLDNIRRVIERAPFAAPVARFVQVAGTNGKGSTSHYIAAILQSAGWRIGLFTSPHLQDVRERIRLDGRPISRAAFARSLSAVRSLAVGLQAEGLIANLPTFFETLFLAALHHYAERHADWVVLEVGLGGRLDATSTVVPEVALITNIGMDHMDILGGTLAAIAREKAGIARRGVPLISGCPPRSTAARVIRVRARAKGTPLIEAFAPPRRLQVEKKRGGYSCRYAVEGHDYRFLVPQHGRHQARNAALAVAAVDALRRRGWPIGDDDVRAGIRAMFIPARIERLGGRPDVIIDGGHNRAGIRALVDYLREESIRGFTLLFGVLRDKQYPAMARMLAPLAGRVVLSVPDSPRALPPEELLKHFPGRACLIERDPARALAVAKKFKRTIIACGSLYLVGAIRAAARGGKKEWKRKNSGRSRSFIKT
jgi:dihydrofolate synthase/folylpolyglutamate synthase